MKQKREYLNVKEFSHRSNYIFLSAPNEDVKESKYDEATQLLVDSADAARKEFDTIDHKHR